MARSMRQRNVWISRRSIISAIPLATILSTFCPSEAFVPMLADKRCGLVPYCLYADTPLRNTEYLSSPSLLGQKLLHKITFGKGTPKHHGSCRLRRQCNRVPMVQMQMQIDNAGDSSLCPVPANLDQAIQQCQSAVSNAILSGNRGLTVEIHTPDLNPSSRGYDSANMHRLCMGMIDCLTKFTGEGEIKLVVQDIKAAAALLETIRSSPVHEEAMSKGHISVDCLVGSFSLGEMSASGSEIATSVTSAVVLVGPTNSRETKVTKEVRDVLTRVREGITLVVNQALDATGPDGTPFGMLPREICDLECAFYLEPFALQPVSRGGVPVSAVAPDDTSAASSRASSQDLASTPDQSPTPVRIAVTRATPGKWCVWRFEDADQRYNVVQTFPLKPSRKLLIETFKDIMKGGSGSLGR